MSPVCSELVVRSAVRLIAAEIELVDFDEQIEASECEYFADFAAGVEDLDTERHVGQPCERDEESEHAAGYELHAGEIEGDHTAVISSQQISDGGAVVGGIEFGRHIAAGKTEDRRFPCRIDFEHTVVGQRVLSSRKGAAGKGRVFVRHLHGSGLDMGCASELRGNRCFSGLGRCGCL